LGESLSFCSAPGKGWSTIALFWNVEDFTNTQIPEDLDLLCGLDFEAVKKEGVGKPFHIFQLNEDPYAQTVYGNTLRRHIFFLIFAAFTALLKLSSVHIGSG
jgi:hypothetical protein